MSVTHLDLSIPLQRAAQAEQARIEVALDRIAERVAEKQAEIAKLRDEAARLRMRHQLLGQIVDPTRGGEIDESPGVVLRGAKLRVEATRLLIHQVGPHRATHYRDWYQLFLEAGFVVLGKRPEATFLTAVSRSPIVQRADEPGTYYIEPTLADKLVRELEEVMGELTDLDSVLARHPNPEPALRQHRVRLLATRRHLESRVAETRLALAVDTGATRSETSSGVAS